MTRQEILDKTINTYNLNNRCEKPVKKDANGNFIYSSGGCYYSGESVDHESPGCAVGQLLPKHISIALDNECMGAVGDIIEEYWGCIEYPEDPSGESYPVWVHMIEEDKDLKEWWEDIFTGENSSFLTSIQDLHDTRNFWDEYGLSEKGKYFVEQLKQDYLQDEE